jgi:ATP cone domain-containing protein
MNSVSDEIAHLPQWVRRTDGSQVPFDVDRICQSLYAAAESLGAPSAFLIRELTDVVLHFLTKDPFAGIPSTAQIAAEIEKIIREVGHPALAQRFAEMRRETAPDTEQARIEVDCAATPDRFVHECMKAYSLRTIFSRDVAAAVNEGLLHLSGLDAPAALSSLVIETARLADLPWWLALDDWRESGADLWIVESPEWLCTPQMHPALTPHLCERLLSLPTLGQRAVELHLNIAEPPSWSPSRQNSLFGAMEEDETSPERSNFLDGLLERWKSLQAPRMPAIAWHLHERSFRDDTERRQLAGLIRLALQGRPVSFVFDRSGQPTLLSEGLDRRCPGVLLQIEFDLPRFANRPDIANDAAAILKKLPSLARIAVSAAAQKRQYLRRLPDQSPLRRRFLIERAAAAIVPRGMNEMVRTVIGAAVGQSEPSFQFAQQVVRTLRDALQKAGRLINLDLRLDCPTDAFEKSDQEGMLTGTGDLHHCAGAGSASVPVWDGEANSLKVLQFIWTKTCVARAHLSREQETVAQGDLLA